MSSFQNVETNEMPLEDEIQHLCALAAVYTRSATGTLNVHNLLRASGLYNVCLVSTRHSQIHLSNSIFIIKK